VQRGHGRALFAVAALVALVAVAFVQGVLPGMVYGETINYFSEGSVRCTHELGLHAFTSRCHALGEPVGFPLFTGGPLVAVGAMLMYLPGVGSLGALTGAQIIFDAVAMLGTYGLMRRLGTGRWVALGTATAWGLSPTVVGLGGFGGTFVGYVLLPTYAYMDVLVMDAIAHRSGRRLPWLLVAYALLRTGALFMDGYSFVASGLVSVCLWGLWLFAGEQTGRIRALGVAALGAANLVALGVYSAYVPVDFPTDPIAIFRAMGLDVVTLALPSQYIWWASKFGVAVDHGTRLWGDTTNSLWNYVGFLGLGLAASYLVRHWRGRVSSALAIAGVVALVLSLGPAFKTDDRRPPGATMVYAMPKDQAPELPWARLFVGVPGMESMRATYRWYGVTRMALIVLAGLAIAELARGPGRRRQFIALVLAGAAIVEVMPTVPLFYRVYRDSYADRTQVQTQVADALDRATLQGERAFFLSYDGSHNDFLVNYLASATGLRAYNAGGDKNAGYAASAWPTEVRALAGAQVPPAAVEGALRSGRVDVVVAPFFHPAANAAAWPPSPVQEADARAAYAPLLAAPRVEVKRERWFATIRLPAR
jgi:hypothetical protein